MPNVMINLSIAGHILLDAELNGRFAVQGNTFDNTFDYLNQYLNTCGTMPEKVQTLAAAMDGLVARDDRIKSIRDKPALDAFTSDITQGIQALLSKQTLMLPGGWLGIGGGHAMIYQFEKTDNGDVLFSIYNSGSGIKHHEKTSSTEKELYSPVKTYAIPHPVEKELQIFIKRLVVPQLAEKHPERKNRKYDSDTLYNSIEKNMPFLHAKLVPQGVSSLPFTTGGQLSGTCTQRSIHQMLKVNFDSPEAYQRFIFEFKLYALKDFLDTHPAPRSLSIAQFIDDAIKNNLKLLQEPGVFDDAIEQDRVAQTLIQLQKEVLAPVAIKAPSLHARSRPTVYTYKLNSTVIEAFNTPTPPPTATLRSNTAMPPVRSTHLLQDMQNLISRCNALKDMDPLWVFEQIEQTILHLPLPVRPIKCHSNLCVELSDFYEDLPFYSTLTDAIQLDEMGAHLETLQELYTAASKKLVNDAELPRALVTQCSLLALRGYMDVHQAKRGTKSSYHHAIYKILRAFLNGFSISPYTATNDPALDQRMRRLISLFQRDTYLCENEYHIQYYNALLDTEPALKKELETRYREAHGTDESPVHRALRIDKCTALYYLLEHIATLPASFNVMTQKIKRQVDLEQCVLRCLIPFMYAPITAFTQVKLSYDEQYRMLRIKSPITSSNIMYHQYSKPTTTNSIVQHKYKLGQSPALQALLADHPQHCIYSSPPEKAAANIIQLAPHGDKQDRIIHQDDFYIRQLFHLRSSPANQVNLTLDYFTQSCSKLADANTQRYFEANLFEPGLLCDALDNDPELLNRFDAFIQKGLRQFSNQEGMNSQESLFFIRLNVYFYCYVSRYKPEMVPGRLALLQQQLENAINEQPDPAILASLHLYRFLTTVTRYQLKESLLDDSILTDAFASYFYIHAKYNPYRQEDTATRFDVQRAEHYFKQWLHAIPTSKITPLIKPMMESIGLDVREFTISGEFPLYALQNQKYGITYTVDAESGRVFKADKAYSMVPLDIQLHPIMRRLGLEHASSCFLSTDGTIIEFSTPQINVRMKKKDGRLVVQKQWTLNGKTDWYELQPLTQKQEYAFGLGPDYKRFNDSLPALFTDGRTEAWISDRAGQSFIVQNHRPVYRVNAQNQFEQIDEHGEATGLIISDKLLKQDALTQFEDPGFFSIHLNRAQNNGTVYFARYDLLLDITDQIITLPGTHYTLAPSNTSPLGPHVAALQFTDGTYQQCIVAVQQFYVAPDAQHETGHYYQFKHDTTNYIALEKLKKHWKDSKIVEKDQPLWYHAHSEKIITITYKLVNGTPKPDTAADAFYLCYLYLAQNEVEKAYAVLDDLNQRLSCEGTLQELTWLSWIIQALPVILKEDDEKEEEAVRETPRYVACQLKALACYTDFLAQGKTPIIPDVASCDLTRANGCYEALCLKDIHHFYNGLSGTIHKLYSRFQRVERHLDEQYDLSFAARKSLLTYYSLRDLNETPRALGALGYEQRRLSLTTLLTEYHHLLAVQKSDPARFPLAFAKRLDAITAQLAAELPVMKKSTLLERIPIDLSLPLNITLNRAFLSVDTCMKMKLSVDVFDTCSAGAESEAMAALSSEIGDDTFITYFPHYIRIARNTTDPNWKVLHQFCTSYLIGHRHTALGKHDSNTPYLINILYRFLNNPTCAQDFLEYRTTLSLVDLTQIVRTLPVPTIEVYQACDVFQDTLATSHDIWQKLIDTTPIAAPIPLPVFDPMQSSTVSELIKAVCTTDVTFKTAYDQYCAAEVTYRDAMKHISNATLYTSEQKAGKLKYDCIHAQRDIAEIMLNTPDTRASLHEKATTLHTQLQAALEPIGEKACQLANSQLRDIDLAASKRHKLTDKELLTLYLQSDLTAYIERTDLSPEACNELHALLHQCVALAVEYQHVQRLLEALNDAGDTPTPASLHHIASVLMAENRSEAQRDPAIMLFQYEENMLLRPRQVEALTHLLSTPEPYQFNETIEKIIMGGGKSKVILPLLSAKKATGLNLVVVEVPRALLATNHVDLNSTSQRLFGQKAHRFEFDRDSDCSPARLKAIYQQFVDIMTHKEYLVTTGESMQSLELKYLELLLFKPEAKDGEKRWQKQVYWASKIIRLVKQSGDVVIDEVHQGLLLKKKLNYTVGEQGAIHPDLIRYGIELYQFLDLLALEADAIHYATLKDRMDNQWVNDVIPRLVDALIEHPNSPLKVHINVLRAQFGDAILAELKAYLNDDPAAVPCLEKLACAKPGLREAIAFYKEQLSLLPQTLMRHHKEHYGPSKLQDKSAIKRALAIPYSANEKPNERSRFGNPLETMNYTIQSMLRDGLTHEMLVDVITQWKTEARFELQKKYEQYKTFDQTPTAIGVAHLLSGTDFTLRAIDPHNETDINNVFEHVQHNKALLFTVLEEQILSLITVEPAILHSDAYNHKDIYHTVQGLSGTPWNYSTFHQDFKYNHNTSLGTDGYIQQVLQGKNTPVHEISFTDVDAFLLELLSGREKVRAIIDVGATFLGLNNLDVAKALAKFTKQQSTDVAYILYFNDADVLCALDVHHPQVPIVLGTSEPTEIERKLNGCKPEYRLTYYDQAHTIGTDIKQAPTSCGLVLIDKKTHLQSFLQGCMRMRGLEDQQTVEMIVPKALAGKTLESLMEIMHGNEHNQLLEDGFISALAKMDNLVRRDLLQRIASLDETDIDKQHVWAKAFERYLLETKSYDLFEQYGDISIMVDTKSLLEQHIHYLINDWTKCLASVCAVTSEETERLTIAMQKVIDTSLRDCKPESISRAKQSSRDLEVETLQEQEILKEQEKLIEAICFDPTLKAVKHVAWDKNKLNGFRSGSYSMMTCLSSLSNGMPSEEISFSLQLFASENYHRVYEGQTQMLGFYLKPVNVILFRMVNNMVTACLVTEQEAEELHGLLKSNQSGNIWLSTTQDTRLAGHRSHDITGRRDYQIIMEQIRFFNGECNGLLEQKVPFLWLNENTNARLAYFEKHIMPYRETTAREFSHLRAALSKKTQGFDYIKEHAFEDLSNFNWENAFPDALPADIAAFKSLAAAFLMAINTYQDNHSLHWFLTQYLLPPAAVAVLQEHITFLAELKNGQNVKAKDNVQSVLDIVAQNKKLELGTKANILATMIITYGSANVTALAQTYLSDDHINWFIQHSRTNKSASARLIVLIQRTTDPFREKMIAKIMLYPVTEEICQTLLSARPVLSPEQLTLLVPKVKTADSLNTIMCHPIVTGDMMNILKHSACNYTVIKTMLDKCKPLSDAVRQEMIKKTTNEALLTQILCYGTGANSVFSALSDKTISDITKARIMVKLIVGKKLSIEYANEDYVKVLVDDLLADEPLAQLIDFISDETSPLFETILTNITAAKRIGEQTYEVLFKRKEPAVMACLIQITNTEEALQKLLTHACIKNNLDLIKQIAAKATTVETFQLIIQTAGENVDDALLISILKHSACNDTVIETMLDKCKPLSDAVRQEMIKKTTNEALLTQVLCYGTGANSVFSALSDNKSITAQEKARIMVKLIVEKKLSIEYANEDYVNVLVDNLQADKSLAQLIDFISDETSPLFKTILTNITAAEYIGEQTYEVLFKRKEPAVMACLIQITNTEEALQKLLTHACIKNNLDLIKQIAAKATTAETFKLIIQTAGENVDDALLISIQDRSKDLQDNGLLRTIVEKLTTKETFTRIINDFSSNNDDVSAIPA